MPAVLPQRRRTSCSAPPGSSVDGAPSVLSPSHVWAGRRGRAPGRPSQLTSPLLGVGGGSHHLSLGSSGKELTSHDHTHVWHLAGPRGEGPRNGSSSYRVTLTGQVKSQSQPVGGLRRAAWLASSPPPMICNPPPTFRGPLCSRGDSEAEQASTGLLDTSIGFSPRWFILKAGVGDRGLYGHTSRLSFKNVRDSPWPSFAAQVIVHVPAVHTAQALSVSRPSSSADRSRVFNWGWPSAPSFCRCNSWGCRTCSPPNLKVDTCGRSPPLTFGVGGWGWAVLAGGTGGRENWCGLNPKPLREQRDCALVLFPFDLRLAQLPNSL